MSTHATSFIFDKRFDLIKIVRFVLHYGICSGNIHFSIVGIILGIFHFSDQYIIYVAAHIICINRLFIFVTK